jgi:predicted transcriptional regulator
MRTVTLKCHPARRANHRFLRAFEGEPAGKLISFETPALLFKVLTRKQWELLSMMTGNGPMTLREAARRVERDVKAVHGDVHALLDAGILQRTEKGQFVFPFDAVHHVNFVFQAA